MNSLQSNENKPFQVFIHVFSFASNLKVFQALVVLYILWMHSLTKKGVLEENLTLKFK